MNPLHCVIHLVQRVEKFAHMDQIFDVIDYVEAPAYVIVGVD